MAIVVLSPYASIYSKSCIFGVEKPAYAGTIKKISCPLVFLSRCLIWLRDNKGQDFVVLDGVLLRTIAAGALSCGNCCFVTLRINLFKKLHLRCRKACLRRKL